jgi:hypothetical protein
MLQATTRRLKRGKRGISTVIVVMLSLVLVVIIVGNVVLWSYQMNQLDWEKMREDVAIVNATSTRDIGSFNPSQYILKGSTSLLSGNLSNLASDDGVYMSFRSYASATSLQLLHAHQETTTIGGTNYYLLKLSSADAAGTTLTADAGTTGRKLMGKFVYQLTGVSSIPTSTWTIYYRAIKSSSAVDAHADVDILIRQADGTVRTTIATNVANSGALTTVWSTPSGTYTWSAYTVAVQTDYLEIDCYIEVTTGSPGKTASLRIDDNTLPVADQTRATNIYLPSEFTSEVEFIGSSNTENWNRLNWTVNSAWTTSSVNVTLQLYNYTLGGYPTSGNGYIAYTSDSTPSTDENRSQMINVNPTDFRNATGYWKMKVKGVKADVALFDFNADLIEFKTDKDRGTLFTFKNEGSLTLHLVSLWINNSTHHQRYDINIFINSGDTASHTYSNVILPDKPYYVKVITERGNTAVFASD